MEHSDLAEEDYRNAAAFAFTDLSAQFRKQGLYVTPLDVGAGRAGEYQLKRALMLALHARNGTTIRYLPRDLRGARRGLTPVSAPQQKPSCGAFLPLPQGQGTFGPILVFIAMQAET